MQCKELQNNISIYLDILFIFCYNALQERQ